MKRNRFRNRRLHQRRLTRRGRISLALLAIGLGLMGGMVASGGLSRAWRAWGGVSFGGRLPDVAAHRPSAPLPASLLDDLPLGRERFESARLEAGAVDPSARSRLVEWVDPPSGTAGDSWSGPLRIEYSLDEALTERVFRVLKRGRVARGHAIVLDPRTGRLLAYVSTDPEGFSPAHAYPAASIVKVLTAAAMIEHSGGGAVPDCVYRGNPYRLNRRRLDRPKSGREASLERALATSNNRCFAQWALHDLGEAGMQGVLGRFGWLSPPASGHDAGRVESIESEFDLARLGSGLDGMRVTPLHVAQLASILTHGRWIEPWWVDRVVDARGRSLERPQRTPSREVLPEQVARRLREMLVGTTTRGTARSAFRDRRGRSLLGEIPVAGKTGNLTGRDPHGRYEWFLGLAPADEPRIAVVVLQLQSHLWWARSSELAADILRSVFCDRKGCRAELAARHTGELGAWAAPLLVSDLDRLSSIFPSPEDHDVR